MSKRAAPFAPAFSVIFACQVSASAGIAQGRLMPLRVVLLEFLSIVVDCARAAALSVPSRDVLE